MDPNVVRCAGKLLPLPSLCWWETRNKQPRGQQKGTIQSAVGSPVLYLHVCFAKQGFTEYGVFFVCFIAIRRPLTVAASPVAEHRLRMDRLSSHGSRAQPLRGMWDLPGPGHEPVSPVSAGGLSTTAPPGKPLNMGFFITVFVKYFPRH